jgi:DNA-binding transcriptional LysR family regulator
MDVSLQDLRYLRVIAEHQSLSAAGATLGVSQPALSKCLKRLERAYGAPVVGWTDGRAHLTEVGEVIYRKAQEIIFDVEDIGRQVQLARDGVNAAVNIGLGAYALEAGGKQAVARYISERPRVRIQITVAAWDHLVPLLRRDHLDFYVADVGDAVLPEGVVVEDVTVPPLSWVCRVGHPLLSRATVDAQALTEYPMVGPTPPARFRKWLMDLKRLGAGSNQVSPDEPLSVVCDNGSLIRHLGTFSNCIGLCARRFIEKEIAEGSVAILETTVEPPPNRIAIVWRASPPMSAAAARLIEIFQDEFSRA